MNTKNITVFVLMVMVLSANAFAISNEDKQEKEKVTTTGTFDGYDVDDGYAFLITADADEEDDDNEETIYFAEITDEALKSVNLKSKDMVGKRFQITYEISEYEEVDENGYSETYETYKIIKVKAL